VLQPDASTCGGIAEAREMARLAQEVQRESQAYAKRPKKKYISANTREYAYAAYMAAWVARIERIGNLNYPEAARARKLYGSLLLTTGIRADVTSPEDVERVVEVVVEDHTHGEDTARSQVAHSPHLGHRCFRVSPGHARRPLQAAAGLGAGGAQVVVVGAIHSRFQADVFDERLQEEGRVDDLLLEPEIVHALQAGSFEVPHRDPFDRMLAAQAVVEGVPLLTDDPAFSAFPELKTLW